MGGARMSGAGGEHPALPCPSGAIVCEGGVAKVCDGEGGFSSETPCAGERVCAANLGCVACSPGSATCQGNTSVVCADDGSATFDQLCDPVQGMSCNPETGRCEGACSPDTLGQSYVGCEYYPTITSNQLLNNKNIFHFAVAVANTSIGKAQVLVTRGKNVVASAAIAPKSVKIVHLPWVSALANSQTTQVVSDGAYRLRSNRPVTVYQYNPLEYSAGFTYTYTNDASLLLPVNAWTGNYRVAARNHWNGNGGLYAVTASEDGTTVALTPSATGVFVRPGGGVASNGSGTVVLDRGDVLQVFTASADGSPDASDLTGTLVSADKPVQVIGGHTCTNVPHNVLACDHLEESIPPLETLATEYIVTAPLISSFQKKPRMVRIVATADGTELSYDPPIADAPAALASAGSYAEIALTKADFAIKANKPVLVAEYFVGQALGGNVGDPAMTVAVATAQFRNEYLFHAPTNYSASYVNIVAPDAASVTLDGFPVAGFTPIGNTGYQVARVKLSTFGGGNHFVKSTLPCGISVYGYGQYTSYWYPGGLDLTPLGL